MGLEAVEMVMAVEDAFEIHIEDSEAENVRTPGQLVDLVLGKVAPVSAVGCLTQRAFHVLRKSLQKHGGFSRQEIRPATKLEDLIPMARRRQLSQQVVHDLGTIPFPLKRSRRLKLLLFFIALTLGISAAMLIQPVGGDLSFLLGAFVSGSVGFIGAFLTRPFRTSFPEKLRHIRDLAVWVKMHKPDLATMTQKAWTREQIAQCVRQIVIDTLNCGAHYREDALFVEDLGMY